MCGLSNDNLDVFKRLLLETENLIERIEEDEHSKIAWICEKESLEETISEAREILWPEENIDSVGRQED